MQFIEFLLENVGTIVVALLLASGIGALLWYIIRDKKPHKSCGCGCSCCPMNSKCHPKQSGKTDTPLSQKERDTTHTN